MDDVRQVCVSLKRILTSSKLSGCINPPLFRTDRVGKNMRLSFSKIAISTIKLRPPKTMRVPCQACGSRRALLVPAEVRTGVDFNFLPQHIREVFLAREIGTCISCGLTQEYLRFDETQLAEYLSILPSKHQTTTETPFDTYPVPQEKIDAYDTHFFEQRLDRWSHYFDDVHVLPKKGRYLFLRPTSGALPEWLQTRSREICAIDICTNCNKITAERVPGIQMLEGSVHGLISKEVADSGPYDGIFVFHVLCHALDLKSWLDNLRNMLNPGGFLLLSDEINWKTHNPFHTLFFTEEKIVNLLEEAIGRVDRIDDCGREPREYVTSLTKHRDEPDLIAWLPK